MTALSLLGTALGDPTRVTMLLSLFDSPGSSLTALAQASSVTSSTASEHLEVLVAAGLVDRVRKGRNIEVSLAGQEAASVVERLVSFSDIFDNDACRTGTVQVGHRPTSKIARMALARTCYDHLAGRLGVAFTDYLVGAGLLTTSLTPTDSGTGWFAEHFGLDICALTIESSRVSARPLVRSCLDWTERRPHLAGRLGASICTAFATLGWVTKHPDDRSLRITPTGRTMLDSNGIFLGCNAGDTHGTCARVYCD